MSEIQLGVQNGNYVTDLYRSIPCTVGYSYVRIEVSGEIRACCVALYPIGTQNWKKTWRSSAYQAFRQKMKRIHEEQFHLKDPEFLFCQQCSHREINQANAELLNKA